MTPSSTWESFSTFLDNQQNPGSTPPGQLPDWSQNFGLGAPPNYNPQIGDTAFPGIPTEPQFPGVPTDPVYPGVQQSSFMPSGYTQPGNDQYGAQQLAGVTAPAEAMDPAAGLFAGFGQHKRNAERRERNRGGAYGSAKRNKDGIWSFN